MTSPHRLVVIGNGMAGARLVEDVLARASGDRFRVTMFGDEPYGNYNRILLSGVLAGTQQPDDIFINPLDWYAENDVTLHAGIGAARIDRDAKVVYGSDGRAEPYDTLVIATGSVPFVPPFENLAPTEPAHGPDPYKDGVYVFRTLEDCERMLARAADVKSAAVIGGGLLGLEAARGLSGRGLEVNVVHLMEHLMEMQLDRDAGLMLQKSMEQLGVKVHLGKSTTGLLGNGAVTGLQFKDGSSLECDLAGHRRRHPPERRAGEVGRPRRSSAASSSTTAWRRPTRPSARSASAPSTAGMVYGLVAPLWEQTAVLADRLTGRAEDKVYEGSRTSTKLKVMGVDLAVMGEKQGRDADDEVVTYAEPRRGVYHKLIVRDGKLAGAILLGDTQRRAGAAAALRPQHAAARRRAPRCSSRWARRRRRCSAADLPDDAQICNCNGVSKGAIVGALRGGCRTFKAVCDATRAGTGCGSCKVQVKAIVEAVAGDDLQDDPSAHYYVPGVAMAKRGAGRRHQGDEPAQRLAGVRRARRRQGGSGQQGRARLAAQDDLGQRRRRGARRALHQRPRPRQHPEGPHLQRRAAHLRRRDHAPPTCARSPTSPTSTTSAW